MSKKPFLILLTDSYPTQKWEPFLRYEMPYLSAAFSKIYIFGKYTKNSLKFQLPPNIEAFHLNSKISFPAKLASIRFLFSKIFWDEVKYVRRQYHLSFRLSIYRLILLFLQQASKTKSHLEKFIHDKNLTDEQGLIYSFWADQRALACALLGRRKNIKGIARAHNWDVYFERHDPPIIPFRKFLYDHLHAVFFVSENGRDYTLEKISLPDSTRFRMSKLGTTYISRNPEASTEEFVVVSCSHITRIKRLDRIAGILFQLDMPVRWIHFGAGPMQESLLKKTNEIILAKKDFQFEFKGQVANDEVLEFYANHHVDLFMLTSTYEGIPMAVMEAQSFGIPVMATNVGGINEVVNDTNGFLLDKNFDVKEAAEKVRNYFSASAESKKSYRENAFNNWRKNFNAGVNYPDFIEQVLSL